MDKFNILFAGCGFLGTHIAMFVIPHADHMVFLDRERIEKGNYDNAIFPKNYTGRRKVMALASLIQLISTSRTTPIHINIQTREELAEICDNNDINFIFVTFDNIEARLLVRDYALESGIPTLFAGVTESFGYIDWANYLVLPETPEEIESIKEYVKQIRDVCTRLEFRPLGAETASKAYHAFIRYTEHGEKHQYQISIKDTIQHTHVRRE